MKRHTAPGLAGGAAGRRVACGPRGPGRDQPGQHAVRHDVGRVPAPRRQRPRRGARQRVRQHRQRRLRPVLQPGRHRADDTARRDSSAPTTTSQTPATAGAAWPSRSRGGARAVGFQLGTFGFKDQPEYTVELPDGTGAVYSVSETYIGLTFAQNFSDRFSAGLTAKGVFDHLGDAERERLRGGLRHQLPLVAEQPPDQVLVRHPTSARTSATAATR